MRLIFIFILSLGVDFSSLATPKTISLFTPQGGVIALPSTEGFLTSRDLLGKQVFLVFGFTTCPDVCPLTLQTMKQVASELPKNERENFRFLFVSIDPELDSLERLKALKTVYGSNFIGATDSKENLSKLTRQFGAFFKVFKSKTGKRIVSHTDSIFYINKEGKWASTLPFGSSREDLLKILSFQETILRTPVEVFAKAELLSENQNCDLANEDCKIQLGNDSFELALNPKPVRAEKKFQIAFKSSSKNLIPIEVDFEGKKLNMGYLRPQLKKRRSEHYEGSLRLPICELDRMEWIVNVFLKDSNKKLKALQYHLTTVD